MSDEIKKTKPRSFEFATLVDGEWTDAPMHDEILDNPEADLKQRIRSAKSVMHEMKLSEKRARKLFDIPDDLKL